MMSDIEHLRREASKAQLELLGYKYGMVVPEAQYVHGRTLAYVPYMSGCYMLMATSEGRVYWERYAGNGNRVEQRHVADLEKGSGDYEFWRRKVFDNFPIPIRELYEQKLLGELWTHIWIMADNKAHGDSPALAAAHLAHVVFQRLTILLEHETRGSVLRLKSSTTGKYYGDPIAVSQLVKHRAFGSELTQWLIDTAYDVFHGNEEKENKDDEDEDEGDSELS